MIGNAIGFIKAAGNALAPAPLHHSSPNQVLRVGVIGVGRIGRVHIESIQSIKDATVTMVRQHNLWIDRPPQPPIQPCPISLSNVTPPQKQVADIWEEGARQVTEQYGIPKYVTDYKDLIASPDVDAVLICSPTDQVRLSGG